MRQNIGLLCLTAGSILLSINVFWGKYFRSWEELPWEQRFFYKLTGGRKLFDFEVQAKAYETVARMQKDPEFRKRMDNRAKWRSRIVGDLPILAILLMLVGFFLSLNYKGGTMSNSAVNIILWVLGVGFGGLITYGVSRRYYVKATKDLKLMTSALAHYVEGKLAGRDLKFEYNDKGEPINVVYGKGSIHATSDVTGNGQIIK
jgi:hypothetical protein